MEQLPQNQSEMFPESEMNRLVQKATEVNGQQSMQMEPFIETYGLEKVRSDYSKVADRLQGFLEKRMSSPEKLGHVFEAAFFRHRTKPTLVR